MNTTPRRAPTPAVKPDLCELEPRDCPRGGGWTFPVLAAVQTRLHPPPPAQAAPPAPAYDVASYATLVWDTQPAAAGLKAAGGRLVLVDGPNVGADPAFAGAPEAVRAERAGNGGLDVYVALGYAWPPGDATFLAETVWHCSGHALDAAAGKTDGDPANLASTTPAWQALYGGGAGEAVTTGYSTTNPQECFAEAYVTYCTAYQTLSPATYSFVDGCVTGPLR